MVPRLEDFEYFLLNAVLGDLSAEGSSIQRPHCKSSFPVPSMYHYLNSHFMSLWGCHLYLLYRERFSCLPGNCSLALDNLRPGEKESKLFILLH